MKILIPFLAGGIRKLVYAINHEMPAGLDSFFDSYFSFRINKYNLLRALRVFAVQPLAVQYFTASTQR